MGLKTFNDRLQAIGLFDKYKSGTKTNATAGGSGGGGTPITGFSTSANQNLVIAELQSLVAKPDTEIIESIGIDTNILAALTISTPTSDSLGIGGGTPPAFSNVTTSSFVYTESNRNYEIRVPITAGFPTTGAVDIYIQYEQNVINPGNDGGSFTLYNSTRTTVLDNVSSRVFSTVGSTSQVLQLSFNNTAGLTALSLVLRSIPSTTGYPASYKVTLLGSTPAGFSPTDLIRRRDTFANNIPTGTTYLDASDQAYTLVGLFLRDSNRSTEERLSTILNTIESKVSTSTNQVTQIARATTANNLLSNQEAAIVRFSDIESTVVPTFPMTITTLGVESTNVTDTRSIISTVVNTMAELVTLWNTNIDALQIVEISSSSFKLIPGTHTLPIGITDFIFFSDGTSTVRVWRKAVFIPTIVNEALASSTDKTVEQLRRTFEFDQYANWEYIKGNNKVLTYYTGVVTGNPSGNTSNIQTIVFRNDALIYLTQTLTYDNNDNILTITTT